MGKEYGLESQGPLIKEAKPNIYLSNKYMIQFDMLCYTDHVQHGNITHEFNSHTHRIVLKV